MKKAKNSADLHQKQGQEQSKKLYRSTSEQAKRLDDVRSCARTISDLFTPNLHAQRRKFCEYCERLIFSDPILYGKKGEELLWRKGYYDVVSTAKRLKKKEYTRSEVINIQTHISSGIGFYHHMIAKLQTEFGLKLKNVIDFTNESSSNGSEDVRLEYTEWASQAVYQCLIYLGDLNRYLLDIDPKQKPTQSFRFYLQAVSYKADHGMPHNQMGTLAMHQEKFLDAVYHYMRCLACTNSFEGTTNNLHSLFEKNSIYLEQLPQDTLENQTVTNNNDHLKNFIARFLLLIDIWYFNKKVSKVYNLCHQTCKDLTECLSTPKGTSECDSPVELESSETNSSSSVSSSAPQLSNDMLFKITVICLMTITKLQKTNSQQLSTVIAFTLAIYSQIVQNIINHIQDQVMNYPLPPEAEIKVIQSNGIVKDLLGKGKKKQKLRRRKAIEVDSEASEDEADNSVGESSADEEDDDDDSFMSDCDPLAESSDEEADNKQPDNEPLMNNVEKANEEEMNEDKLLKKVKRMYVDDMLEIITEESALHSIKVINDWLMQDTDILKSCGSNTRSLLRQLTDLLNLINIDVRTKLSGVNLDVDGVIKNEKKIPLSEDVVLKGLEILSKCHKNIDWDYMWKRGVNTKEEAVIRIVKLMTFGKFLTGIEETGISFDEVKNEFVCKCEEAKTPPNVIIEEFEPQNGENSAKTVGKDADNKGQLLKMKHMGQLWLASEVRALENRIRGKASLSPYLVLDADALIKYTFMIKHLVHSRKFIVLVPSAVVSALDDLKREQSEARDAIRWLELQFHRGNRFFRAQRPQEKAPIPFIKYPKKKDKEMTNYIQIIECCHYLAEQQKGASNLVTLLIGNQNLLSNGENKEFSYVGLAKSAGVSIESITMFYSKWKKSYKGKR